MNRISVVLENEDNASADPAASTSSDPAGGGSSSVTSSSDPAAVTLNNSDRGRDGDDNNRGSRGGGGNNNISTTGGAAMNNSDDDANPSPSSNSTHPVRESSSAAEEELEQRLADLRAILPDASNEELHEILGENDRASNKVETYIGRYLTRPFDMAEYTQQEERRNYDESNFTRNGLERIPEATVFTDDPHAKAARCRICSVDLFISAQAKSFICPRCGATSLDEGDKVRITSTLRLPSCRE